MMSTAKTGAKYGTIKKIKKEMLKEKILNYIKSLDKGTKIMIFESSDLSEQINEIESIPEGILESLGDEKDIFDNKNQYSMF